MSGNTKLAGQCPKCQQPAVACRYNFFDRGDLQVHSWEHRCTNCGWRETKAFRSDDAPDKHSPVPDVCPLCGRRADA
jgi:hypothetical protein